MDGNQSYLYLYECVISKLKIIEPINTKYTKQYIKCNRQTTIRRKEKYSRMHTPMNGIDSGKPNTFVR